MKEYDSEAGWPALITVFENADARIEAMDTKTKPCRKPSHLETHKFNYLGISEVAKQQVLTQRNSD